ncbi:hypothetical protein [Natranaerobius trueperi]|uniref:Uncharacterized protein n=1 Tax=Natranaerobius trueperi TaxID=759412 RepID=A0A226C0S8_9FIRM|nr:hypothetical protein [Natranaerobius trueperi]OWZ84908.1 hypothetical protein CDO51_00445 [Natranaerobius trueperi]
MLDFIIWFLAAYGLFNLIVTIWEEISNRRKWTFVAFVNDPKKAEAELRSFLAELPAYKTVPTQIILIFKEADASLKPRLQREFPNIKVEEYIGEKTLEEVFGKEDPGRVVVLDC